MPTFSTPESPSFTTDYLLAFAWVRLLFAHFISIEHFIDTLTAALTFAWLGWLEYAPPKFLSFALSLTGRRAVSFRRPLNIQSYYALT